MLEKEDNWHNELIGFEPWDEVGLNCKIRAYTPSRFYLVNNVP